MQRARTHDPLSMMPERVLRLHTLGALRSWASTTA